MMCGLSYIIVTIFSPVTVWSHFVWPLSNCLQADICNHTWIPECGSTPSENYRLFIDECDMYEFNCDSERDYEIANYSLCFNIAPHCPDKKFHRMGDFRFELEGQKVVYDPIKKKKSFDPSLLPGHMRKGKRRYTPEVRRRMMKVMKTKKFHTRTTKKMMKKPTKAQLKKETVIKNGKKMIKIVKVFKKVTKKVIKKYKSSNKN